MFTIRYQLEEVYQAVGKQKSEQEMISLLEKVGLKEGRRILDSYPHQLSGGMAQRVAIALALASSARLLIADEPTTALDANLKKSILNLLLTLKEEEGLSIFFISHDLDQIFYLADQIYIFYAGRVLEFASGDRIKKNPLHPYTQALLKCLPRRNQAKLEQIKGQSPSYQDLPSGCKFHPRCEKVMQICQKQEPGFYQVKKNHLVKCYLYQDG
jgi:oligopeptide/dipeptide ABC transporter ATP-binding protein